MPIDHLRKSGGAGSDPLFTPSIGQRFEKCSSDARDLPRLDHHKSLKWSDFDIVSVADSQESEESGDSAIDFSPGFS